VITKKKTFHKVTFVISNESVTSCLTIYAEDIHVDFNKLRRRFIHWVLWLVIFSTRDAKEKFIYHPLEIVIDNKT